MKKCLPHRKRRACSRRGFTLVELMAAEVIFLILLGLIFQLVFGITQTAQAQKQRMDALGDARAALDRLNLDWTARVRRGDINAYFLKQAGNDQINFLTLVQSYSGTRQMAWVSYQVNTASQVTQGSQVSQTLALQRGIAGYNWLTTDSVSGGSQSPLAFPFTPSSVTLPAGDYEPLANTVFRLEFCFLQHVTAGSSTAPFTNTSLNLNSSNLVGVVVAIAALDQQSRQILTAAQVNALAAALGDNPEGQDPQSYWSSIVNNSASLATAAGVPVKVAGAVRVFQRIFYVSE